MWFCYFYPRLCLICPHAILCEKVQETTYWILRKLFNCFLQWKLSNGSFFTLRFSRGYTLCLSRSLVVITMLSPFVTHDITVYLTLNLIQERHTINTTSNSMLNKQILCYCTLIYAPNCYFPNFCSSNLTLSAGSVCKPGSARTVWLETDSRRWMLPAIMTLFWVILDASFRSSLCQRWCQFVAWAAVRRQRLVNYRWARWPNQQSLASS